jgi:hypothetical protein
MNPVAEIFVFIHRIHNIRVKITRERSIEFYPLDPGRSDRPEKPRKSRCSVNTFKAGVRLWPVAIHILADQMNFFYALATKFEHLPEFK